jgi:3-deoxy-manno-octulosonate cytidylyltransferase (CMP-KDO synthetase)
MKSTRLPNKPLAMIGDKPMILHVMEKANQAGIGKVYVACAEQEIADVVNQAGGCAVLTDPNHPSGGDRIKEALDKVDKEGKIEFIINLQGDLPLIDPLIIKKCQEIMTNSEVDIGTFASPITDLVEIQTSSVVKIALAFDEDATQLPGSIARAIYFSRSPIPHGAEKFWHHIGIYVYRRKSLEKFVSLKSGYLENCEKLEQLRALENGMRIDVGLVDTMPIGVDTKADLDKVIEIYNSVR